MILVCALVDVRAGCASFAVNVETPFPLAPGLEALVDAGRVCAQVSIGMFDPTDEFALSLLEESIGPGAGEVARYRNYRAGHPR